MYLKFNGCNIFQQIFHFAKIYYQHKYHNFTTHKKSTFNSFHIHHIKLAAGYSAAHIHIATVATNGHNSINSIHSSYEQVDFVVNECWVYCHGDILLQCCSLSFFVFETNLCEKNQLFWCRFYDSRFNSKLKLIFKTQDT
jgi:hypothetical protein